MARTKALDEEILTDSAYWIMVALSKPIHGYAIMQNVKCLSNGEMIIGPASLYTILKKLQTSNLITLIEEDRKKIYKLTTSGEEILKKDIKRRIVMVNKGKEALEILNGEDNNE